MLYHLNWNMVSTSPLSWSKPFSPNEIFTSGDGVECLLAATIYIFMG